VAKHDHVVLAEVRFLRRKGSAEERLRAEDEEAVRSDVLTFDTVRRAPPHR
jgi:hypothetical protein